MLMSLAVAMVLGALHALSPGHGKTVVAAYLVGARGTARHALFLGAIVTATHTVGVYALGLVTLALSQYVLPEQLYPVLQVASGLLVVGMGAALLLSRLQGTRHAHPHGGATHSHGGRSHGHPPGATVGPTASWRGLLALGVSGGLLPCPSALVVLLTAIALHRVAFGLLLIVAFSMGLAVVLVGIGLLLVYARAFFIQRVRFGEGLAARWLPVASALAIMAMGLAITLQALPQSL
jgi:ABC-type nickel/cobalt efflux system permease component RcnA